MALAVTQPYISKQHIELIDSNTDPAFNQIFSALAFLAQAQQALIKLQNRSTDPQTGGTIPSSGADYIYPKNTTSTSNYKTAIDLAIGNPNDASTGITGAIAQLYKVIADANS